MRIIQSMEARHLLPSLQLVEEVFTQYENPEEGKLVRSLEEEIIAMANRAKDAFLAYEAR